jgi:hypothetical protein
MTDAAVTSPSAHGRIFPGDYRRFLNGVVIGLGAVVAVCVLVTVTMVLAAWIINITLATNRYIHAPVPIESGTKALAKYDSTLASAPHAYKSARLSTAPADDPEVTFEAKWARAMAPAQVSVVTLVPEHPPEGANNVLSPPPPLLDVPHSPAKSEKAHARATLNPDAAPAFPLPSTLPLPLKAPEWSTDFPLPRPHPSKHEIAGSPVDHAAPQVALSSSTERNGPQQVHNKSMSLPDPDSRTAIYDISARTVYLPSGEKLEAHSGLGDKLDDPRYVHVKMRGPTHGAVSTAVSKKAHRGHLRRFWSANGGPMIPQTTAIRLRGGLRRGLNRLRRTVITRRGLLTRPSLLLCGYGLFDSRVEQHEKE